MKRFLFLLCAAFSFLPLTVNAITWNAPETISTALVDATDPRVVVDSSGNATAIWLENGVVMASTHPFGGSWSAASAISGMTASAPQLDIDSSGRVYAAWIEGTFVRVAEMPQGGSWGASTIISDAGATEPKIAVAPNGDIVAAWTRGGFIETNYKLFGFLWNVVSLISGASSDHVQLAIADDGYAVAVWHTIVNGADILVSSNTSIGGTWSSPQGLIQVSTEFSHDYPALSVDSEGNAACVWHRFRNSGVEYTDVMIFGSTLPKGAAAWTPIPAMLSGPGVFNPADLSISITHDSKGNILAFWTMSLDSSVFDVEMAMKLRGKDWTGALTVVNDDIYSYELDVSADSLSDAQLAFMQFDGSTINIQTAEVNISGIFDSPFLFQQSQPSILNSSNPKIKAVLLGDVIRSVGVWENYDGMNVRISAATGSRQTIQPPSNPMVTQSSNNFGVVEEFFNTITWDASPGMNVAQYQIFRNGIYIGFVGSGTLEFTDHNVNELEAVTYGVSALDFSLNESLTVTVNFP